MIGNLTNKNCLLLQGPMGPFFRRLDRNLRKQGARVFRICLNGGDFFFSRKDNSHHFRGTQRQWPVYFERFLNKHAIDKIFLYGDCRFYHKQATIVAKQLKIEVLVFEEGYLRPHFVTLEKGGVNAYSDMPGDAAYYRNRPEKVLTQKKYTGVTHAFGKLAVYAALYYAFMRMLSWYYPHYRHHRNDSVIREAAYGMRNGWRKVGYRFAEREMETVLKTRLRRKYFFVPLQAIGDAQISCHSTYTDMKDFIGIVLRSFAENAPKDLSLVIKHHPQDRGRVNYSTHIQRLARDLDIAGRVLSVHDVHLPTCLKHAVGTVTVNSTVGISSLVHCTPTIVLGKAVYDIKGLTCRGMTLDRFWREHRSPDRQLFSKFRMHLIEKTQLTGSFYSGFPEKLQGPS